MMLQQEKRGRGLIASRVFTIALIGADGAGKSTIARRIEEAFPLPLKYLYMGVNPFSSNFALPTTRLAEFVKRKLGKDKRDLQNSSPDRQRSGKEKPKWMRNLKAAVRIACLLPEEWYRQLISWSYQMRGYCVLYDRHFAVDFEPSRTESETRYVPLADRLHRWLLGKFYPRPDLVIFLDAPPEVLYARKGEGSLSYLRARRDAFLDQGKRLRHFFIVDASLPLGTVCDLVFQKIFRFYETRTGRPLLTGLTVEELNK